MSRRLKELIGDVRDCKTAAQERAVIAKELAAIRTSFKKDEGDYRQRNMAKLIYIHTLGYPTTFAQMECLKLVVSPYYSDKRIGYLGLMLLMDERQEVLMLVTNSLVNDLKHPNHFIVGLALCSLANIASPEMCRDCSPHIEKLLQTANPYIKKKATLCATRICRKVPDLRENFVPLVRPLLSEKNHGVKLTGITLLTELLAHDRKLIPKFRDLVPTLVRNLKALTDSGYAPEYDVSGVTDPFLQTKLLQLLRILGQRDAKASEQMNDVLAQVATNTETVRNVGNAILYEAVQTIMTIKSETGLKVLAINILGKFLANKDNNIRYVALNTLSKVVSYDVQAVQRHRNTIVDCLKDVDVSIRRRALDLIYALVNPQNVRILVRELLNFLLVSDVQFRPELTAKLCAVAERHAPNRRWHIDTMLRIISLAGSYVPEQVPHGLIFMIGNTPELHGYAAHRMFDALKRQGVSNNNNTLTQVGVWCIGEYGDLLVAPPAPPLDESTVPVSESDVLELLEELAQRSMTPTQANSKKSADYDASSFASVSYSTDAGRIRAYITTALAKLSTRFSVASKARVESLLERFSAHIDVEVQQRAVEYLKLNTQDDAVRRDVTQRMPVLDEEQMKARGLSNKPIGEDEETDYGDDEDEGEKTEKANPTPKAEAQPVAPKADLIDLDDVFGSVAAPAPTSQATPSGGNSLAGLDDIFGAPALVPGGGGGAAASVVDLLGGAMMPTPQNTASTGGGFGGGLDDLLGGGMPSSAPVSNGGGGGDLLGGLDLLGGGVGGGAALATSAPALDIGLSNNNATTTTTTATTATNNNNSTVIAYDKNNVKIVMLTQKHPQNANLTMVQAQFHNSSPFALSNFVMQVAVPKYITLKLEPATSTSVAAGATGQVTQVLKLSNSMQGQRPIVLKVKLDYVSAAGAVSDLVDVQFPAHI